MNMLLGLGSLAGLSLFLARVTNRPASVMPLVSVSICMLWFTLFGCLGLLYPAGWAWYGLCAVALVAAVVLDKGQILKRLTPGFLLFLLGGAFLITVFYFTQPLLTQWDEFTFWGTAAKVTTDTSQLYVVANSNLIARTYPPGLIVFSYAMQFFAGGFAEHGFIAALCIVYLAAFAAGGALLEKHRPAGVLLLACFVLLPLFFETTPANGDISRAYLTCYADPSLAALFGGAIALYFGGGKRSASLLWMLAAVLAALTGVKDIGLALACIVALVVLVDLLVCEKENLRFYRLTGGKAWWVWLAVLFGASALAYLAWALYLKLTPAGVNRFDLGSGDESLGMAAMLIAGVLAIFGINRTEQFRDVTGEMLYAFVDGNRPVSLIGPGIRVFLVIVVLLVFAWLLASTRVMRRRILAFAITSTAGFVAFYIFNIFTYAYIFKPVEALVLKDYERYMFPYWQGWLAGTLVLLGGCIAADTENKPQARWRVEAARLTMVGVAAAFIGVVALRGNAEANALHISPSLYTERWYVSDLVSTAQNEGMTDDDVVYIVNQDDDGTHFYMLGYEMKAIRVPLYNGTERDDGGNTVMLGTSASRLIPMDSSSSSGYPVRCTPEILAAYLEEQDCTGILLDIMDDAFYDEYKEMFTDGLAGWLEDGTHNGGPRYYTVTWPEGECRFAPLEGGWGLMAKAKNKNGKRKARETKTRRHHHWLLPICYGLGALVYCTVCLAQIWLQNAHLYPARRLALEEFTLESILVLEQDTFVTTDSDPQMIFSSEDAGGAVFYPGIITFAAEANRPTGEIVLYYETKPGQGYTDNRRVWATLNEQGHWQFDLTGKKVHSIRLDPDSTKHGVVWQVEYIEIGGQKPARDIFAPTPFAWLLLLGLPLLAWAALKEGFAAIDFAVTGHMLKRRERKTQGNKQ